MSILLVLWILLNSETSKIFADSSSLDQKEQAHQNCGIVGVYFETKAKMSISCEEIHCWLESEYLRSLPAFV